MANNKQTQARNILNKVMGFQEIKKLNIDLFEGKSERELKAEYDNKKASFIAKQMKDYDYSQNKAEGSWLSDYPRGYEDWVKSYRILTGVGQQRVIDKVNEIIEFINKK